MPRTNSSTAAKSTTTPPVTVAPSEPPVAPLHAVIDSVRAEVERLESLRAVLESAEVDWSDQQQLLDDQRHQFEKRQHRHLRRVLRYRRIRNGFREIEVYQERELSTAREEIKLLRSQLAEAVEMLESARDANAQADDQHRSEVELSQQMLAEAETHAADTAAQLDRLSEQVSEYQTRLQAAEDRAAKADAALAAAENRAAQAELRSREAEELAETAVSEAIESAEQRLADAMEESQAEREILASELEQSREQVDSLRRETGGLEHQIGELESIIAELESQLDSGKQAAGADGSRAAEAEARAEKAESRVAQAESRATHAETRTTQMARELDEACERIIQLESQLQEPPGENAAPADAERMQQLTDELESLVHQCEQLQSENADLADQIAELRIKGKETSPGPTQSMESMSWEQRKAAILEQLRREEAGESISNQESESLRKMIEKTESEIVRRDNEIEELRGLLERQSASLGTVGGDGEPVAIGAAGIAQLFDTDELIREERERLKEIEQDWKEKLRQAEIELSLERAKIARGRRELEQKQNEIEERLAHMQRDEQQGSGGKEAPTTGPRRRWLRQLGLGEDT
jgi:chromosome segregation ATPase